MTDTVPTWRLVADLVAQVIVWAGQALSVWLFVSVGRDLGIYVMLNVILVQIAVWRSMDHNRRLLSDAEDRRSRHRTRFWQE